MSAFDEQEPPLPDIDAFARRVKEADAQRQQEQDSLSQQQPQGNFGARSTPEQAQTRPSFAEVPQQAQQAQQQSQPTPQQQQPFDPSLFRDVLNALHLIHDEVTALREQVSKLVES